MNNKFNVEEYIENSFQDLKIYYNKDYPNDIFYIKENSENFKWNSTYKKKLILNLTVDRNNKPLLMIKYVDFWEKIKNETNFSYQEISDIFKYMVEKYLNIKNVDIVDFYVNKRFDILSTDKIDYIRNFIEETITIENNKIIGKEDLLKKIIQLNK
jgi:hypothetical protein